MSITSKSQQQQTTIEDGLKSFREAMADVVSVAETLAPHCPTTLDLIGVVKLALESDSQLRLLLSLTITRNEKP